RDVLHGSRRRSVVRRGVELLAVHDRQRSFRQSGGQRGDARNLPSIQNESCSRRAAVGERRLPCPIDDSAMTLIERGRALVVAEISRNGGRGQKAYRRRAADI